MQPFRGTDTFSLFQNIIESTKGEIDSFENNYFLSVSYTDLENFFVNKVTIDKLSFNLEEIYISNQSGVKIDARYDSQMRFFFGDNAYIRGINLEISIPFSGDRNLWMVRPSRFSISGYPDIQIKGNEISFCIKFPEDNFDSGNAKAKIDRTVKSLGDAIGYLSNDVSKHNSTAPNVIKQHLSRKRERALATTGTIASLGIPIKRSSIPPTFSIPTKRRERPTKLPSPSIGTFQPESTLDEGEYQFILGILRSMSLVIERNPSSFSSLDEESIRDHFLIQLNGHYEGGATGETFNAAGKTDILIREGDRNVFIAECKFWRGQKGFKDAIQQLLSYLTWRDAKCALLIFSKNKDSAAVLSSMHDTMKATKEYRKTILQDKNSCSYILVKDADPCRDITVTTQLYIIPTLIDE